MRRISLLLASFLGFANCTFAEESKIDRLINSCQELVQITDQHMAKRLTTVFTTSVAEAMRAGYCHGVLDEYARENSNCRNVSLYQQANYIATLKAQESISLESFYSREDVLRQSCGR